MGKFFFELVRFPRKRAVFLVLRRSQVEWQAALDEKSKLLQSFLRHVVGGNSIRRQIFFELLTEISDKLGVEGLGLGLKLFLAHVGLDVR